MDDRVFRPVVRSFEETWPNYSYAPLTWLVLRATEWWRADRRNRVADANKAMRVIDTLGQFPR